MKKLLAKFIVNQHWTTLYLINHDDQLTVGWHNVMVVVDNRVIDYPVTITTNGLFFAGYQPKLIDFHVNAWGCKHSHCLATAMI